jgi:L-alanine-DL-glutamate epimerase-like enolase superfamily enzyme
VSSPAISRPSVLAGIDASAFVIPTDAPESDGTIEWNATTLIVVRATSAGVIGVGFSYADESAAGLIHRTLAPTLEGRSAMDVEACHAVMVQACRNIGRPGIASCAISAVDIALWDLKARLLDIPLTALLGQVREEVPIYGSGGFTSYSDARLQEQLGHWADTGMTAVKMKVGRDPEADVHRVHLARDAIGAHTALFVDANGAYARKQALAQAEHFSRDAVVWFEEPVSSDDLCGLRLMRDRAPAGMEIAAGEYGYDIAYFRQLLEAGAVDVLQADATRCGGLTGFLKADTLCDAWGVPLSAHTAPTVHAHAGCAAHRVRHLEYFHDHVRIEQMLFDGVLTPQRGALRPDPSRPGLGVVFKAQDAAPFAV